jgi:hypothetical protein
MRNLLALCIASIFCIWSGNALAQGRAFTNCGGQIPTGDTVIVGPPPAQDCLVDGGNPGSVYKLAESTITAVSTNTALSPPLPINCTLFLVTAQETSGNAVTGGLIFGTSSGGTQVLSAPAALGANGLLTLNPGAFLAQQIGGSTLYVGSPNWGSAVVNVQAYCLEQ